MRTTILKTFLALCLGFLALSAVLPAYAADAAPEIKHRLLVVDESRAQLHYVDQTDPSKDWTIQLADRYRDIQWIGSDRVLMSTARGYEEIDLKTQKTVKRVDKPLFDGSASVRRLANGHTLVGCNQNGLAFFELGADDQVLTSATFPTLDTLRLFRLSPRGTLLLGSNGDKVTEVDMQGKILRSFPVEGAKHIYQVLEKPDGRLLVAIGYGAEIAELDAAGKRLRTLGGKPGPEGLGYNFFCGMQVLKNGDTVVCNWTGHGPDDSNLGVQLLQFNPKGEIVWKWHDPKRSGSVHGVIVVDDLKDELSLDPSVLK